MKKGLIVLCACVLLLSMAAACSPTPRRVGTPVVSAEPQDSPPATNSPAAPQETPEASRPEVVFDLSGLNLINHNLADSVLLTSVELLGNQVIVVDGVDLDQQDVSILDNDTVYAIFNDAWAIELYYFTRRSGNAVDAVAWSARRDDVHFLDDEATLDVGIIRANADSTTALMSMRSDSEDIVLLYLAQNLPGSNNVIVLDIVVYMFLLEEGDDALIAELSNYLGVDLSQYIR